MRVGVIGLGSMGKNHARVFSEIADLVAVCDTDEAKLWRWGTARFTDVEAMLDGVELDAVSVAVPTPDHCEIASMVIAAGIPVLVEKPLAATSADCRGLVRLAAERKVGLATGHIERFNPVIAALRERWGQLGAVSQIFVERMGPYPVGRDGVGVALDLSVHDVDLVGYVSGDHIATVHSRGCSRNGRPVSIVSVAETVEGVVVSMCQSWTTPTKIRRMRVLGENGMFVADLLRQELTFYANDYSPVEWPGMEAFFGVSEGDVTSYKILKQEPLRLELGAFLEMVKTGNDVCPTGEDGLEAVRLAELIEGAAQ